MYQCKHATFAGGIGNFLPVTFLWDMVCGNWLINEENVKHFFLSQNIVNARANRKCIYVVDTTRLRSAAGKYPWCSLLSDIQTPRDLTFGYREWLTNNGGKTTLSQKACGNTKVIARCFYVYAGDPACGAYFYIALSRCGPGIDLTRRLLWWSKRAPQWLPDMAAGEFR